jgi:hypothetical protein
MKSLLAKFYVSVHGVKDVDVAVKALYVATVLFYCTLFTTLVLSFRTFHREVTYILLLHYFRGLMYALRTVLQQLIMDARITTLALRRMQP